MDFPDRRAQAAPQSASMPSERPPSGGKRPLWRRGIIGALRRSPLALQPQEGRSWSSLFLHRLNEATAHSTSGLFAAAAILAWVVFGFVTDFPGWWDNVLYVVSSTVTLLMVFAIQHTQARQQSATQRKLDEILRSLPRADGRLIAIEEAPDAELEDRATRDIAEREEAVGQAAAGS